MKALSYHCNIIHQYNTTKQNVVVLFLQAKFFQLPQGCRPTMRKQLTFNHKFPRIWLTLERQKTELTMEPLNLAPEQGGLSFLSLKKQHRKNWQIPLLTCKTFFFNLFSFKTGVSQKVITDFCIFVFSCFNDFAHI